MDQPENLWESAANDASFRGHSRQQNEQNIPQEFRQRRESMDLDSTIEANVNASVEQWGRLFFVRVCAVLDAGLALLLTGYMTYYQKEHSHNNDESNNDNHNHNHQSEEYSAKIVYGAAIVLLLRSLLEASNTRCGLHTSGLMSLILSLVYAIVGLTVKLQDKHGTFSNLFPLPLPSKYQHHAWGVFLFASVVECCRWALLQQYETLRFQENNPLRASSNRNPEETITFGDGGSSAVGSRRRTPWWLPSSAHSGSAVDTSLQQSLLEENTNSYGNPTWAQTSTRHGDYSLDDGVGTPRRKRGGGWWPFSSSRSTARTSADFRDDGSVEYASLNEDWTNRSQQDPHWWSRDDDVGGGEPSTSPSFSVSPQQTTANNKTASETDTSWADGV